MIAGYPTLQNDQWSDHQTPGTHDGAAAPCVGSAAWAAEWSPLLPEQLNWIESPAYPGVTFALLAGGMGKPGFFTVRAKFPPNYQLGPHTHTDDRGLTILVGSWKQAIMLGIPV